MVLKFHLPRATYRFVNPTISDGWPLFIFQKPEIIETPLLTLAMHMGWSPSKSMVFLGQTSDSLMF